MTGIGRVSPLGDGWRLWVRRLSADTTGNVVLMFAVMLLPLTAISIGALDYGRMNSVRSQLQSAIDAGLSFAASRMAADEREIGDSFRGAFKANLRDGMRDALVTFQVDKKALRMEASASIEVPVHVLGVLKGNRMTAEATGTLSVAPAKAPVAEMKRNNPERARQIDDAEVQLKQVKARIESVLGQSLPEEAFKLPDGANVNPAEVDRLSREILRQLGQ